MKQPDKGGRSKVAGGLVRRAIASSVKRLTDHEPGVIRGRDVEHVHQARVAVRRLRSHLRSFRSLVDERWSNALRQELRWLGTELGAVRDLDVFIARLSASAERISAKQDPGVAAVIAEGRALRSLARKRLVASMRSARYHELRDRLERAARAPRLTLAARLTVRDAFRPVIKRRFKRVKAEVESLPPRPTARKLHRVRILAKRLRYAAEAAVPAEGSRAERFADCAAALQDVLGELNDAESACTMLRRWRRRPELALAANALLSLELEASATARSAWPSAWRALCAKDLRSWL